MLEDREAERGLWAHPERGVCQVRASLVDPDVAGGHRDDSREAHGGQYGERAPERQHAPVRPGGGHHDHEQEGHRGGQHGQPAVERRRKRRDRGECAKHAELGHPFGELIEGAAWRSARAAVALGMLAEEEAQQNAWYLRGEVHAARAVAADSLSLDALFWFTAAKGQLAVQASVRDAARLGQEVWRLAHRMLAIDPDHAGARNVLGRLQYEVMTLSRIERFLARMILGSNEALRSSSWEGAERHQLRAVALDPEQILYRYDLARIHMRRGRPREAEAELGTALALPARTHPDFRIHTDARRQLARLEARR